jgi:2-dehydro-3-deoxyglucarate aldolase
MFDHSLILWLTTYSPDILQIYSQFSLPVVVDLEHTSISDAEAFSAIQFLNAAHITVLVRCPSWSINPSRLNRFLDLGCNGFILPSVKSAAEVENVWSCITYPSRGACVSRMNQFSQDFDSYKNHFVPLLIPMIECVSILDDLQDLFALPYVKHCLLGPYDLSQSFGVSIGNLNTVFDFGSFLNRARSESVSVIKHSVNPDPAMMLKDLATCDGIAISTDLLLLNGAISCFLKQALQSVRLLPGHVD